MCRSSSGTAYPAANGLKPRLVKQGVLSEMTGYARNLCFRDAPYIALFDAAGPAGRTTGVPMQAQEGAP